MKTLTAAERKTVKPSDQAGIMIEMMNSVNDAVTYALVAFTALALLVSTVMIGILTYISVIERTREIGVIRSLGGRRRDVSRLFTSEAAMIGAMSGAFGAAVTVVLAIAANAVTASVSGGTVGAIARVTPLNAAIMTGVSILLTLISGLLPARAAAMKDPAVALRTD